MTVKEINIDLLKKISNHLPHLYLSLSLAKTTASSSTSSSSLVVAIRVPTFCIMCIQQQHNTLYVHHNLFSTSSYSGLFTVSYHLPFLSIHGVLLSMLPHIHGTHTPHSHSSFCQYIFIRISLCMCIRLVTTTFNSILCL